MSFIDDNDHGGDDDNTGDEKEYDIDTTHEPKYL